MITTSTVRRLYISPACRRCGARLEVDADQVASATELAVFLQPAGTDCLLTDHPELVCGFIRRPFRLPTKEDRR